MLLVGLSSIAVGPYGVQSKLWIVKAIILHRLWKLEEDWRRWFVEKDYPAEKYFEFDSWKAKMWVSTSIHGLFLVSLVLSL